jgi:hypothetical protein
MHVTKQLLVRIGVLGCIRPLAASDGDDYPRSTKVLCQTERGIEVGEILAAIESSELQPAGRVVRALAPEDDSRLAILRVRRNSAYRSCQQELKRSRIATILIDAEPLFDGRSLYFYFADEVPKHSEALRLRLCRAYQAEVYFQPIERQGVEQDAHLGEAGCDVSGTCGCDDLRSEGCRDDREGTDGGKQRHDVGNPPGAAVRSTSQRRGCGSIEDCAICNAAEVCQRRQRLHPDLPVLGSSRQ